MENIYDFLQAIGFAAGLGAIVWFVWSRRAKKPSSKGKSTRPQDGDQNQK